MISVFEIVQTPLATLAEGKDHSSGLILSFKNA